MVVGTEGDDYHECKGGSGVRKYGIGKRISQGRIRKHEKNRDNK